MMFSRVAYTRVMRNMLISAANLLEATHMYALAYLYFSD